MFAPTLQEVAKQSAETAQGLTQLTVSANLFASLIGIGANVIAVGLMAALAFTVIGRTIGNRVSPEVELAGLDVPEMGVDGYIGDPGIQLPDEARHASSSRAHYAMQHAGGQ